MSGLGHMAISASAGTGKTYQLAHRFIRLLALGVPPERIAAMTFSRKAAGEIFDSIVEHLCRAATHEEAAREAAEAIEEPGMKAGDFLGLLGQLLGNLHRLHIGTLDSFTVSIVRSFPLELGVTPDFTVMDAGGAAGRAARQRVLAHLFDHREVDADAQRAFREAFKLATFGREEKNLDRLLDQMLTEGHERYLSVPVGERWGQPQAIWGGEPPWPPADAATRAECANRLRAAWATRGYDKRMAKGLLELLDFAEVYDEQAVWNAAVEKKSFRELMENLDALRAGEMLLHFGKKEYAFPPDEAEALFTLLGGLVRVEINRALRQTQGLFRLLDQFESHYDRLVRRQGELSFHDTQYLLSPVRPGGRGLTRSISDDKRLYLDYRLDARLDHWLLDEFQDTSDLQWDVLRNLVDEVIQDPDGTRSFFYVGDVKQAIYGWRGGNARLFGRILEHYGGAIEQRPLNTSYRSCRPVIDTVNAVFSELSSEELPARARTEWKAFWAEHSCAEGKVPSVGYAAVVEPPCDDGNEKPGAEERYELSAALLREIDPLRRGLSAALLVSSNRAGHNLVQTLRRTCPGIPVVHEGRAALLDNPVVALLASLVRYAAHPGDTLARRHLEMSPLADAVGGEEGPHQLLSEMQAGGFQAFFRQWGERLNQASPLDAFGRQRLRELVDAAADFDASGGTGANLFMDFLAGYELHEQAGQEAVRVMTIHQAKGLGFDLVILPDLQARSLAGGRRAGEPLVARDAQSNEPRWLLNPPRQSITDADPTLCDVAGEQAAGECFESLCKLYVAMTRAKKGLYVVSSYPGKSSRMLSPAAFVKERLCAERNPTTGLPTVADGFEATLLYEAGESTWFEGERLAAAEPAAEQAPVREPLGTLGWPRRRSGRLTPSEEAEDEKNGADLFLGAGREARAYGTAIHELFELVSWLDETDLDAVAGAWSAERPEEAWHARVIEDFRKAMAAPEVATALARPAGPVELWREKPFEVILDDRWVTGTMDRVVLQLDKTAQPVRAAVLDYKSNAVRGEDELRDTAEHYRPQLELYAAALAQLTGLAVEKIALHLLFTRPGRLVTLVSGG